MPLKEDGWSYAAVMVFLLDRAWRLSSGVESSIVFTQIIQDCGRVRGGRMVNDASSLLVMRSTFECGGIKFRGGKSKKDTDIGKTSSQTTGWVSITD